MTGQWEYLSLTWRSHLPANQCEPSYSQYTIRRPGASDEEERPGSDGITSILNELGAEGWELVVMQAQASRVGKSQGWVEVGFPVRQVYIFKRLTAGG